MTYNSYLDQFKSTLLIYTKQYLPFTNLSLDTISLYIVTLFIMLVISLTFVKGKMSLKPSKIQFIFENIYLFVLDIVKEQGANLPIKYFPVFYTIFFTILVFNLSGIVPCSLTLTSQIVFTGFIAFSHMIGWIIIGLFRAPIQFLASFIPGNVPLWIKPLLCVVEIISFLIRPVSLSVRLFANMMAGHILLHIIIGVFTYAINFAPFIVLLPVFGLLSGFFVLELGIAILQAYIFTVMLVIYLKEIMVATLHKKH